MKAIIFSSNKNTKLHTISQMYFTTYTCKTLSRFRSIIKKQNPDIVFIPATQSGIKAIKSIRKGYRAPQVNMYGSDENIIKIAKQKYPDLNKLDVSKL